MDAPPRDRENTPLLAPPVSCRPPGFFAAPCRVCMLAVRTALHLPATLLPQQRRHAATPRLAAPLPMSALSPPAAAAAVDLFTLCERLKVTPPAPWGAPAVLFLRRSVSNPLEC